MIHEFMTYSIALEDAIASQERFRQKMKDIDSWLEYEEVEIDIEDWYKNYDIDDALKELMYCSDNIASEEYLEHLSQLIIADYNIKTKYVNLEDICNADNLIQAFHYSKKGVFWKESVQRFELNKLDYICKLQKAIRSGSYKQKPLVEFELKERGHTRHIKSHHISDRVVQRSLNDHVLLPLLQKFLIYDNGASMKNKGLSFARNRFKVHLQNAYKEYNGKGYILLMDFSKFFDNIPHDKILKHLAEVLSPDQLEFMKQVFKEFEIDVSYMSDEEYDDCLSVLFNSLEYNKIDKSLKTKEKFMAKSVGIGSHTSQISGVYYPHEIDDYCKIVKGLKYYGRYMDDTYIIMETKEELEQLYTELQAKCKELGIFINMKKTHIKPITSWITYLKINYYIAPGGRIIEKVHQTTFQREHGRLKKFKGLMDAGAMTFDQILECYKGWRGTYKAFDSGYEIYQMDKFFKELFNLPKDYKFEIKSAGKRKIKKKKQVVKYNPLEPLFIPQIATT